MLHFHFRFAALDTESEAAAAASLSQFRFRTGLFVEQRKRPQGNAGRQVGEVGITAALCIDAAQPAQDGDVLLAILLPGHRMADDAGRSLEAPKDLSGIGIERLELTRHHARRRGCWRSPWSRNSSGCGTESPTWI